ncbi:MAG: 2-polyprenylphenol 6-hydroxylase [Hyphomicrobiales bacterium]|nr:2-polyprenylphenol 6-hydroxylase [Hyphomicrobiales bacterium]MDE2115586.1 2-polyprenylphenol 6-hydroxylase [Hyphomicrobiales bacterium]
MFADIGHFVRLARAGAILAREGVFADVDGNLLPASARIPLFVARLVPRRKSVDSGNRIAIAMARLGPSYVKLGQFLATRPDVVGMKMVRELESLQDRMAPFGRAKAVEIIEAAFEGKIDSFFVEFSEPVAAASIAQVHRATLPDGSQVAVKVVRPGVQRRFRRDLSDMFFAARLAERLVPDAARLRPVEVVETLARSMSIELDLRLEAAAASEFAENCAQDTDFRVPKVDWDRTAKDVLTLEWVDGIPLSDLTGLEKSGRDLPALGRSVIQSFLRHAMRDGFFHADMHPGNLFMDSEGRLVAVDFGIMGRLGRKERRFLAEILFGFITRNYRRVAEVHFEAGYVPRVYDIDDFAQAIRAIGEPIHSRTADQISMAKLLTLLFEVTALFEMRTRTELVMLQKTMVVVEGVARTLDPHLNMWVTSEPVVRSWIEENLGPVGRLRDLREGAGHAVRFVQLLPKLATRMENWANELPTSPKAEIRKAEATLSRWAHLALWLIVILLAWLAMRGR